MNFPLGILFIWMGAVSLWVAFHGDPPGSKPWDAFSSVVTAIKGA